MFENQIIAEIREARPPIDVSHRSISCRHYRIGWLAAAVALQAPDVQALVHLPALRSHATKRAARPGLADGAHEKLFLSPALENRPVCRRQSKGLGANHQTTQSENCNRQH